jgi:hypothetical protein
LLFATAFFSGAPKGDPKDLLPEKKAVANSKASIAAH